jgi:hypothetical protein
MDPGIRIHPKMSWILKTGTKVVLRIRIKALRFIHIDLLKFLRIFDKVVRIGIFLTHPDPGGQFITDLPDPEHSFFHNILSRYMRALWSEKISVDKKKSLFTEQNDRRGTN